MKNYELVIWLEIHVKIQSATKLFCACRNEQDFINNKPNSFVCPFCTGQPGALPSLQLWPVQKSLLFARALNCRINNPSHFDRKSYFYPDLPAGYQITQFFTPYAVDGQVSFFSDNFSSESSVAIRAMQMEVDTAKSIHDGDSVFLDFNRAGTPLVEVVTQPDFRHADNVISFLKELQRIVRYNGIGDADMEKGQMRVDVNCSIREMWSEWLNDRVELKNMNSFTAIRKAIEREYQRQVALVEAGKSVEQQTRGWDEKTQDSFPMRTKENALDYRYFPEPDLPPLLLAEQLLDEAKAARCLVPYEVIKHHKEHYGFHKEYINVLISSVVVHELFEDLVQHGFEGMLVAKRLAGPLIAYCRERFVDVDQLPFSRDDLLAFLTLAKDKKLIENQLKIVMKEMLKTGKSPSEIVDEKWFSGWGMDESTLKNIISEIMEKNGPIVEQYRWGKESAIGFFVGQVMRATKGQVDPKEATSVLKEMLAG